MPQINISIKLNIFYRFRAVLLGGYLDVRFSSDISVSYLLNDDHRTASDRSGARYKTNRRSLMFLQHGYDWAMDATIERMRTREWDT